MLREIECASSQQETLGCRMTLYSDDDVENFRNLNFSASHRLRITRYRWYQSLSCGYSSCSIQFCRPSFLSTECRFILL